MKKIPVINNASPNRTKQLNLKILKYSGFAIGAVILIFVLIFILFPDHFMNTFLKSRIIQAFNKSYPSSSLQLGRLHYSVWRNNLECDSITLKSPDYNCSVGSVSVKGISLMRILLNKDYSLNSFNNSVIEAEKTTLTFNQSLNELYIDKLHVSVHDSEMVVDSIKFYSLLNDVKFFAKSNFRQTRFCADISTIKINGLDCIKMLQGNIFTAKYIFIHNVFTNILVNMDKPYDKNSSKPLMPNEFLASIKEKIKIDSIKIFKGNLRYSEQYVAKAKPGVITFNNINISVSKIANNTIHPDTTIIIAEGLFMNSGKMKLLIEIPLTAKTFSLHYSGSLSSMEARKLNSFIEPGEHHRIKSGVINSANFNINVSSGRANGELYIAYKDLSLAILNKNTGSEHGIMDRFFSLIGKIFIIRGSNQPDEQGIMKIGKIKYSRASDDYFMQFLWFGLRSGLADVVGFPSK